MSALRPLIILGLIITASGFASDILGDYLGPIDYKGYLVFDYPEGENPINNIVFTVDSLVADNLIIVSVPSSWSYSYVSPVLTLSGGSLGPGGSVSVTVSLNKYFEDGEYAVSSVGTTTAGEVSQASGPLLVGDLVLLNVIGMAFAYRFPLVASVVGLVFLELLLSRRKGKGVDDSSSLLPSDTTKIDEDILGEPSSAPASVHLEVPEKIDPDIPLTLTVDLAPAAEPWVIKAPDKEPEIKRLVPEPSISEDPSDGLNQVNVVPESVDLEMKIMKPEPEEQIPLPDGTFTSVRKDTITVEQVRARELKYWREKLEDGGVPFDENDTSEELKKRWNTHEQRIRNDYDELELDSEDAFLESLDAPPLSEAQMLDYWRQKLKEKRVWFSNKDASEELKLKWEESSEGARTETEKVRYWRQRLNEEGTTFDENESSSELRMRMRKLIREVER